MDVKRKLRLHPLINADSPHYDGQDTSAIEELEKILTVTEMMGFCKANIFKYEWRLDKKGQMDQDLKKIITYKNYLSLLSILSDMDCPDDIVSLALEKAMIPLKYKEEK